MALPGWNREREREGGGRKEGRGGKAYGATDYCARPTDTSPLHLFPPLPISWSTWLAREVNNHQKSQCLSRAAALCAPTRAPDANMTPAGLYYELLELLHRRRIFTCSHVAATGCTRSFIRPFFRGFSTFFPPLPIIVIGGGPPVGNR